MSREVSVQMMDVGGQTDEVSVQMKHVGGQTNDVNIVSQDGSEDMPQVKNVSGEERLGLMLAWNEHRRR